MNMTILFTILAAILALPPSLFVASLLSLARARWLAIPAGIIGDVVTAVAGYVFVIVTGILLDGLDYFLGMLFACSAGVLAGALIANFLVSLGSRHPEVGGAEF